MKLLQVIIVAFVILSTTSQTYAEENYCHDKASWTEWEQLLQKYPEDTTVQTLYALRVGLCTMVEREQLSVSEGMKIFETHREDLITKRGKEQADKERELVL